MFRAEHALLDGKQRLEESQSCMRIPGLASPVRDVMVRQECIRMFRSEHALLDGKQRL